MDIEKIRSANRMKPFRPFEIHTASGESYMVPNDETMLVTPEVVILATVNGTGRFAIIDLDSVTELTYDIPRKNKK